MDIQIDCHSVGFKTETLSQLWYDAVSALPLVIAATSILESPWILISVQAAHTPPEVAVTQ